jgi:ABC-type uncharacterized transport system substrate-binding protein
MWALCKKLMGVKSVGVICKFASSFVGRRNVMREQSAALEKISGVKFTDLYMVNTLDEWKELVLNWKEDLIHLGDTGRITDGTRIVDYKELTKWTVDNAKVPVIAASEIDVEAGAVLSIVNSEQYISYLTSSMVSQLLKGVDVSSIPMQPMDKGRLVINATTVQKMGLDIPYEILSSAEKIYE